MQPTYACAPLVPMACGRTVPRRLATRSAVCALSGAVLGSTDADVHQVSNLQADNADLVTLHVYSPPLVFMGTYDLTSASRGLEPMAVEFCDAAGI